MYRTEIEDFAVKLNKDDILRAVGCGESGAARFAASRCFDELKNEFEAALEPYAAAVRENDKIYCLLTLGDGVFVAAGTTLTRDLSEDDFCIGRCRETVKPHRGRRYYDP